MEGGRPIDENEIMLTEVSKNFDHFKFNDVKNIYLSNDDEDSQVFKKLHFNLNYSLDITNVIQNQQMTKIYLDNILTDT